MMRFGPWPPESCVYCQRRRPASPLARSAPTQPSRSLRAAAGSERVGVDRERVHVSHAVEEVPQELRRHLDVGVGRGAPLAPGVAEDAPQSRASTRGGAASSREKAGPGRARLRGRGLEGEWYWLTTQKEGWEDGTPPPHRDTFHAGHGKEGPVAGRARCSLLL